MAQQHINILLLGEIGVGKSTYINAFNNYVKYPNLHEAEKRNEISYLVAAAFNYTNEHYETIKVELGHEQNECPIDGQSSTLAAKAYPFELEDKVIQFIDTPGFGDYRGIEVDKKNFYNTVEYLRNFDHIDAIMFLLKPNTKLSNGLLNCFKLFFTYFNTNAIRLMCFGFTHTRSTLYKPGDTLPLLRQYFDEIERASRVRIPLSKDNIFCLDNESFRYMVLSYNGMKADPRERDEYAKSWEKSATSSALFLTYVLTFLKPRSIYDLLKKESDYYIPISAEVQDNGGKKKKVAKPNPVADYFKLLCSCIFLR